MLIRRRVVLLVLCLGTSVMGKPPQPRDRENRRIQRRRGYFSHKLLDDQVAQESNSNSYLAPANKVLVDGYGPTLGGGGYSTSGGGYLPGGGSNYLSSGEYNDPAKNSTSRTLSLLKFPSNGLQLGLSFTVPFMNIPLDSLFDLSGGTSGSASLSSLFGNLNLPTMLTVGALIAGAVVGIPWLVSLFTGSNFGTGFPNINLGRSDDEPGILASIDEALSSYNLDAAACMQRSVCSYVKSSANNIDDGQGNSFDKILDGVASNSYLQSWFKGTRVMDAVETAKGKKSCSSNFDKCPLSLGSAYRLLSGFLSTAADLPL